MKHPEITTINIYGKHRAVILTSTLACGSVKNIALQYKTGNWKLAV